MTTTKKLKTLILDYSKWRSGGELTKNKLGIGSTKLLNEQGFECCLGQFCKQLNPKIKNDNILGRGDPCHIKDIVTPLLAEERTGYISNTLLSNDAISINDDESTTPSTKIRQLQKLFKTVGYTIKVINKKVKSEQ